MKPNSQECIYFGRKLSNIVPEIEVSQGYVCIGSECDDSIYFDMKDGRETLKERVTLTAMKDDEDGYCVHIDLEGVLKFARIYCNGIYERILKDVKPSEGYLDEKAKGFIYGF